MVIVGKGRCTKNKKARLRATISLAKENKDGETSGLEEQKQEEESRSGGHRR